MAKFELKLKKRNNPTEDLIADLRRVASELGEKTVTANEYGERGNFGVNTFLRRFGSWNASLEAADLEVVLKLNVPEEHLFENLAEIWQHLGRQPVGKDIEKSNGSKYALGTYEKRFGSWNKALTACINFINETSGEPKLVNSKKVKTKSSARTNRKINWRLRATVLIRDGCICKMCGASPTKNPDVVLHVDHIKPWSKGGETVIENLQTLCSVCNVGKSAETFEEED